MRLEESWGQLGMAKPLLRRSAPAPALGRRIAQELTKGAFGWGSPLKFKKRSKHVTGKQRGEAQGWLQSSLGRTCACLCVSLFLFPVASGFLGRFLVEAPSLAWLIQGKSGLLCARVGKSASSRSRTRGDRAEDRAIPGRFLDPCSLGNFCSPLSTLLPSPTPKAVGQF